MTFYTYFWNHRNSLKFYQFLWLGMKYHECLCFVLNIRNSEEFPWIPMNPMNSYTYLWNSFLILWIPMTLYEVSWIPMSFCKTIVPWSPGSLILKKFIDCMIIPGHCYAITRESLHEFMRILRNLEEFIRLHTLGLADNPASWVENPAPSQQVIGFRRVFIDVTKNA